MRLWQYLWSCREYGTSLLWTLRLQPQSQTWTTCTVFIHAQVHKEGCGIVEKRNVIYNSFSLPVSAHVTYSIFGDLLEYCIFFWLFQPFHFSSSATQIRTWQLKKELQKKSSVVNAEPKWEKFASDYPHCIFLRSPTVILKRILIKQH